MNDTNPNSNTLANRLAEQIREEITDQQLMAGDFFMTGDEVAQRFGVSRGIAREAISQLRALGMLQSRQSKGLIVGKADLVGLLEQSLPFSGYDGQGLLVLAQLRYALEVGAVDLAVANATDEQLGRLTELASEYHDVTEQAGHNEIADELELAFHRLILEMTGNPLIAGMHGVLSDYFQHASEQVADWTACPPHTVWEHEAIALAFARRDTEMARAYLKKHLTETLRDLEGQERLAQ